MARIEIRNIYELDEQAKSDFKAFSHSGNNKFYRHELKANRLSIYAVLIDGFRVGTVALRSERQPFGGEMVVVAGGGTYRGEKLTPLILGYLENSASRLGEKSIRFHTKREGLVKMGLDRGYFEIEDGDPDEVTLRKVLS